MTRGWILVVDDEPKIRQALTDALRHEGHDVVATGSPREALRVVGERPFDLVVLDNLMPELSGIEVIREMVATTNAGERPEILMMTAHATVDSAIEAADAILNCRSRHALPARLVAHMKQTRIVVQAGVGFNHIDIEACAARGIPVCNTPDYGTIEVADHALAMTLDLLRATTAYNLRLLKRDDAWSTLELPVPPIRRIRGLTFGIIGLGRIGLAAAKRAEKAGFDGVEMPPIPEAECDPLRAAAEKAGVRLHSVIYGGWDPPLRNPFEPVEGWPRGGYD